ncbi:MAG: hypothetical protein MZV63_46265 [Marinilabiliales bacterium]|nr:hypothetical protein [Marinilabiliales bacterium]
MGDFYETFGEDAVRASGILGIVLTAPRQRFRLVCRTGRFPAPLPRPVPAETRQGRAEAPRSATSPKTGPATNHCKRGVTELVTPKPCCHDKILDQKENSSPGGRSPRAPQVLGDRTSSMFPPASSTWRRSAEEVHRASSIQSFRPSEVIIAEEPQPPEIHRTLLGASSTSPPSTTGSSHPEFCQDAPARGTAGTASLKGFGVDNLEPGVIGRA